ncbi:MAG: SIMPL domain-containing protein [Actinomycetota bacterium]|nr:SIMPL domain-containing protein [Actinomycetota bacterium]
MKKVKLFLIRFIAIFIIMSAMPIFMTGCIGSKPPRYTIAETDEQIESETVYGRESTDTKQAADQKTIVVSSESVLKTVPNLVNIIVAVITEKPSSAESVNENTIAAQGVISAISNLGISDIKIETQGFNLNPLYNYVENMPPSIYAYRTVSSLKITTESLEKIGDIIAIAIESGANEISSINYDLSESLKKETKSRALSIAVKDADLKAEAIAEAMAADIVEIFSVNEKGTSFTNPVYYMKKEGYGEAMAADVASPEILPQEIEVRSEVEVVYIFR